jgi:hypothetical protein
MTRTLKFLLMTIIQKKAELLQFSIDLEDLMQIILLTGSIRQIIEEVPVSTGLLHRLEVETKTKNNDESKSKRKNSSNSSGSISN